MTATSWRGVGSRPRRVVLAIALLASGCSSSDVGDTDRPAAPEVSERDPTAPSRDGSGRAPGSGPGDELTDELTGRRLPDGTVLVWTRGELPERVVTTVDAQPEVAAVTVVEVASAGLVLSTGADGEVVDETADGWRLPVEVLAVDPASYAAVTGVEAVRDLGDGAALLSTTSADVREMGVGGRLVLADGAGHEVVDVVADELVGAAEVLVAAGDAPAGAVPRYLLASPADRDVEDLAGTLSEAVGDDPPVRVRRAGETPVLRHADAVTAPVRLKAAFGEFALRDAPGRDIEQDPDWIDEHVVSAEVRRLGEVACHREALGALRAALDALEERGAADLVEPSHYAGCWAPRLQAVDRPLSSHAWGVAIDLDPEGLPQGSDARPPAPLVEAMAEHGFTNGADWLLPDPMHFELVPDRDP